MVSTLKSISLIGILAALFLLPGCVTKFPVQAIHLKEPGEINAAFSMGILWLLDRDDIDSPQPADYLGDEAVKNRRLDCFKVEFSGGKDVVSFKKEILDLPYVQEVIPTMCLNHSQGNQMKKAAIIEIPSGVAHGFIVVTDPYKEDRDVNEGDILIPFYPSNGNMNHDKRGVLVSIWRDPASEGEAIPEIMVKLDYGSPDPKSLETLAKTHLMDDEKKMASEDGTSELENSETDDSDDSEVRTDEDQ